MEEPKEPTLDKAAVTTIKPLGFSLPRGGIPIYRRGYSARRRPTGRTLIWEGGKLMGASLNAPEDMLPFPGAVVGSSGTTTETVSALCREANSGTTSIGSLISSGVANRSRADFSTPRQLSRGSRRGRPRGRGRLMVTRESATFTAQTDEENRYSKAPEVSAVELPQFTQRQALPTDMSLPVFQLASEDPIPQADMLLPTSSNANNIGGAELGSGFSSKMKSSGEDDIDLDTLKNYRRFNGYTLFTIVSKKKYGLTDDGSDSKSQNRRWQALWSTLPEKVRKHWAVKARRCFKQMQTASEKKVWANSKRELEIKKTVNQLERATITKYNLLDLAAHFKLLSESLNKAADLMGEYRGPVSMENVESTLLDSLLTCLIPLTAIANEFEPLSGTPNYTDVCAGLTNLSYVFPTI